MRHIVRTVTITTSLMCGMAAYAAENTMTQLPEITVTAGKESLVAPSLEAAKEAIRAVAGGAALVPAEAFRNTRAITIKDMLDYTPGVFAQPRYAEEVRLSIRGSGLSRTSHLRGIKLLQDGLPINLADGGGDFQDIDPLTFRYVEVFKGANALRYGSSSLGGAINFVTPSGYDASKLVVRADGGSFNTRRVQLSSGQVIGNTDYFASVSRLQSDGFREFSEQKNTRFSGNIGHKLSDNLETRFYVTYGDINQQLPGNLTKAQLDANPEQENSGNKASNYQRDYDSVRIANKTTWRGDQFEVNGGVYTTQKDLYHPIFQILDQQNSDYGVFANSIFYGTFAGKRNEFTVGSTLSTGETDAKRYVNRAGSYGTLTSDAQEKSRNADLIVEERFYVRDDVALIAGSQFVYALRDYDDEFLADGNRSGEKDYVGASPKLGVLLEVRPQIQVYSNLSRAYEPPTFSELTQSLPGVSGLADIDAQRSTTLEVGSRGEWQRLSWDASLYRSWLTDELMSYALGSAGQTGVVNAGDTIHQGLELGFGVKLMENMLGTQDTLKWRLAYTYSDFHFDGDRQWGDNDIPGAPAHYLRSELRYDHPSGFFIAPHLEAVPEGYAVDMRNTLFSDAYALVGITTGIEINDHVSLFVDARNLTDKKYAATTGIITQPSASNTAQFIPGDGRSIYAGLTVKW